MCDNQGANALVKNSTHHSRKKHIDIQHHFICKKIKSYIIEMRYVSMEYIIANVLIKALQKP